MTQAVIIDCKVCKVGIMFMREVSEDSWSPCCSNPDCPSNIDKPKLENEKQ